MILEHCSVVSEMKAFTAKARMQILFVVGRVSFDYQIGLWLVHKNNIVLKVHSKQRYWLQQFLVS